MGSESRSRLCPATAASLDGVVDLPPCILAVGQGSSAHDTPLSSKRPSGLQKTCSFADLWAPKHTHVLWLFWLRRKMSHSAQSRGACTAAASRAYEMTDLFAENGLCLRLRHSIRMCLVGGLVIDRGLPNNTNPRSNPQCPSPSDSSGMEFPCARRSGRSGDHRKWG